MRKNAHSPGRGRPRGPGRAVAALGATALLVTLSPGAASASAGPAAGARTAAPAAAGSARAGAVAPEAAAARQARSTGRPVAVAADTTPTDLVYANPDGSFTLDRSLMPTRVRQNGAWVAPNADLRRGADGGYAPAAATDGLVFSGGGSAPLVTLDDAQGHSLRLTWPGPLPAPEISGASATYRNVYPGVDLEVSAEASGGFDEVLIVHDAAAAANPALARLKLGVHGSGIRLSADANGALSAVDSRTGAAVFRSQPSRMWDSRTAAAATARQHPAVKGATGALDQASATSNAQAPAAAAHRGALGVSLSGDSLVLTPDASVLAGPGVVYPVYEDPGTTVNRQDWDFVAQSYPTQPYWDGANSQVEDINGTNQVVARVGYDDWNANSNAQTWSYFDFNVASLKGLYIQSGMFQVSQIAASDVNETFTMYVAASGPINSGTDYDNAPGNAGGSYPVHSGNVSGDGLYKYDVTTDLRNFNGAGTLTFKVYESGTNDLDYRWLNYNPTLAVTYWHYPPAPTAPVIGAGGASLACSTNAAKPTWVSKTDGGTVSLSVTATTPDTGYQLWAKYSIAADGGTAAQSTTGTITAQSGNNTLTQTGYAVHDGYTYAWSADVANPEVSGPSDATCYFRVDETSPTMTAITSSDFSQQGGGPKTSGQSGVFTATAADGGSNPSGVNHYLYNLGGSFTGASKTYANGGLGQTPSGHWPLNDATCASYADETVASQNAYVSGKVTCGSQLTDTQGLDKTPFGFDGSTGYLATKSSVVDTAGSYSVSAWVYLTSTAGWNTAVAQAGTEASGFYLQYSLTDDRWSFSFSSADVASPTALRALSSGPPQLDTWTNLVATYDASSHVATLYVNGQAQGTVSYTTPFATSGPLLIGRSQFAAAAADFFHGDISSVQTYARALTPAEAAAIASSTNLTVTPPTWGANTLWVATVDAAGNESQPQSYSFYAPAPPYTQGVTGDVTQDGEPDLLAVDKAGNVRIYSPLSTGVDAVAADQSTTDPLQYGGTILLGSDVTTLDPQWQAGTFAGALLAHGGSFSGKNVDDLMVLTQNSIAAPAQFYLFGNPGNGTSWQAPVIVGKPTGCATPSGGSCSGYSASWSAVKEMLDVPPATASGRPGLVTLEESGGVWSVYYYAPAATGIAFADPVLVSTDSSGWHWGGTTLLYAGDITGDGTPDLLVRELNGNLAAFSGFEAGVSGDPGTARVLISSAGTYTPDAYPYVVSSQAVEGGDPLLWIVAADGQLSELPITPGATPALGTATTVSQTGWAANLQALENSYIPYDNDGISADASTFAPANSFDGGGSSYSNTALTTGFTAGTGISGGGLYSDPAGDPATGLAPDTIINTDDGFDFTWPDTPVNSADNFDAAGQVIPAPVDQSGKPGATYPVTNPAASISFLGSGAWDKYGDTGTATLTWSDGETQSITLDFSDWTLGGATESVSSADQVVGSLAYRDSGAGTADQTEVYLFEDTIALTPPGGKTDIQLASITLPVMTGGQQIHIFSVAEQ